MATTIAQLWSCTDSYSGFPARRCGTDDYFYFSRARDAVEFYPIVISFDILTDAGERTFFKNLPTTFALPMADVDRLIEVGGRLLNESPEFKRLLKQLQ